MIMEFDTTPVPPFDFDLSAKIFSEGDERIRRYENGTYWQVLRLDHKMVLATLCSSGNVDRPELSVKLMPDEALSGDDVKKAEETVRYLFSMNLDLKPFYEAVKGDLVMSKITQVLGVYVALPPLQSLKRWWSPLSSNRSR